MMMPRQSPARAPERKAPAKPKRPELRVVDPKRDPIRPARVGTIAGVLLFLALLALAAFQTVLIRAQDHLDDLNSAVAQQTALDQQLKLQLADLQSPEHIAQVARDRLGMIAPKTVTFLEPTPQDDANAHYVAPPPKATPPVSATASKPSTTTKSTTSNTGATPQKPATTTTTPKSTPTTTPKPTTTKSTIAKAGTTGP
jgi:cell division protein FtsB